MYVSCACETGSLCCKCIALCIGTQHKTDLTSHLQKQGCQCAKPKVSRHSYSNHAQIMLMIAAFILDTVWRSNQKRRCIFPQTDRPQMGSASPGPFVNGLHQLSLPWAKGISDGTMSPNLVDPPTHILRFFISLIYSSRFGHSCFVLKLVAGQRSSL